jgi:DnaJ like chaperone protein
VLFMSIWGKIIGGMTGFALGGPLGALVGAVAGHAYDTYKTTQSESASPLLGGPSQTAQNAKQMAFSVAVIVLGAKMAKADGAVTRAEVNAFKEVFRIRPEDVKTVGRVFDAAKEDAAGFEPYAEQVAELFRHEPTVLEELLAGLFHVARADGGVSREELGFLKQVARIFGLSDQAFHRVRAAFDGERGTDPYEVLGVDRGASDAEVKQTYRKLIRENHPDTLIAKGMPQEFIDVANGRMAAINAAYDQIEKERGLR